MLDDVSLIINALTSCEVPVEDSSFLSYVWQSTGVEMMNFIKCETIPEALDPVHTRLAAGRYISYRYQKLCGDKGLQVPSKITEGNISVEMTGTTDAERLKQLGDALQNWKGDCVCFRRLYK